MWWVFVQIVLTRTIIELIFVFYRTRHRDRVYIVDKHVRQMVGKVGQDVSGVSDTTMATLHVELQRCAPPLDSFLSWCISNYGTDVSFPPSICALFTALGKSSPVCALLPQLDSVESLYEKLKNDEPIKQFPHELLLQNFLTTLLTITHYSSNDQLPQICDPVVTKILWKIMHFLNVPSLSCWLS